MTSTIRKILTKIAGFKLEFQYSIVKLAAVISKGLYLDVSVSETKNCDVAMPTK